MIQVLPVFELFDLAIKLFRLASELHALERRFAARKLFAPEYFCMRSVISLGINPWKGSPTAFVCLNKEIRLENRKRQKLNFLLASVLSYRVDRQNTRIRLAVPLRYQLIHPGCNRRQRRK